MIVLSLVLVIVAAVTLIAGFFQDESLTLIYVAIVSCVLAMGFLGVGVLQRKRSSKPATAPSGGYGPGTGSAAPVRPSSGTAAPSRAPVRPGGAESAATSEPTGPPATGDDTEVVVRKTDAGEQTTAKKAVAKKAVGKRAVVKKAPAASPDATVTKASAADVAAERAAAGAKKAPAKKTTAKAATSKKAAAKKTTAAKKTPAKKTTAKKAPAKKTTAKAATSKKAAAKKAGTKKAAAKRPTAASQAEVREILSSVKGLGPAKQDAILAEFGSVAALKQASVEQLADIRGVGAGLAAAIKKAVK